MAVNKCDMSADALLKLLHKACGEDDLSTVRDIVENQHCDPLASDENGNNAVNIAASSGSLKVLKYLIKIRNCSPECPGNRNRTPLHNACEKGGNLATVQYLVEECGCNVHIKDDEECYPLLIAAIFGHLDILKYLIERWKCDPECTDKIGRTPLYFACMKSLDMVKYLIETHNCNPMRNTIDGNMPYVKAGYSDDSRVIKYLIEERKLVDVTVRGAWNRSLLHTACIKGNLETVRYLIEKHNLDPLDKDEDGFTSLDCATSSNHPHVMQYFIDRGYTRPIDFTPIHPRIQSESGTMTPDWCPVQTWDGDIVFLNKANGAKIVEDPRAMLKRYQLALKDGYVLVHLAKILIIGAAGVGKTHLMHQLFGDLLPDVRRSTPIMMRPVQSIQALSHDGSKFQKVTDAQLYELLGHSVNDNLKRMLNSPLTHSGSFQHGPKTVINTNSQPLKESAAIPDSHSISKVVENLVEPIAKTKDAEPLCKLNWVYFIDSGGQPQFHQLLPAFIHNTNLNVFVLRLCDKFSDCPNIEYYDEEGNCVSSSPSLLSTKEILQCCAQATQTLDKKGDSRFIIVGTHRDLENTCDEKRHEKNELLLQLFKSSMQKYIMQCDADKKEVMHPLNAKEPDEEDLKVIAKLCNNISFITGRSKPKKIPIRWLIFHQEIQTFSKKNFFDILSIEHCNKVAESLHMQKDDITAALLFFSNLNVILYYPEILPEVVFVNSQTLLNIVTLIISYIVYGKGCTAPDDPVIIKARSEGIVSTKLLKWITSNTKQHHEEPMLNSKELMKLLQHVGVVCRHNKDYFMPSLLKGEDTCGINTLLSQNPDSVAPCAIHYEDKWLECGAFAFLITSLLSHRKRWKLASDPIGQLLCVYSNIIKLYYNSTVVTLVDFKSHIEIHVDDDIETCKDSCHKIISSILRAFKVKPKISFVCPCKKYERHVATFNLDTLRLKKVLCFKQPKMKFPISEVGTEPLVWIKGESTALQTVCDMDESESTALQTVCDMDESESTASQTVCEKDKRESTASQTVCDKDKVLTEENCDEVFKVIESSAPKWREIGRELGFNKRELNNIAATGPNSPVDCLEELLFCWLKWAPPNHKRPNQKTLAMVLRSQKIGEEALANKLGQHSFY